MQRKISVIVAVLTVFAVMNVVVLMSMPTLVFAQEPVAPQPGPEVSFGWVVVSWLVYSIAGLISSVSGGKSFDGFKFTRTLLLTLLVAILAVALHITPVQAATTYGPVLEEVIGFLLNTGPCTVLIYAFNKLYDVIMNLKAKLEATRIAATSPPTT